VREGEKARPFHLGRREKEEDRLLLVTRIAAVVELELAHALAAALVERW